MILFLMDYVQEELIRQYEAGLIQTTSQAESQHSGLSLGLPGHQLYDRPPGGGGHQFDRPPPNIPGRPDQWLGQQQQAIYLDIRVRHLKCQPNVAKVAARNQILM